MLKKFTAILLTVIITVTGLCSCSGTNKENEKISIVCTVFPYYDWVRNIVGDSDRIELSLLLDSGTDLHSYQPTAADIVTISSADIFIYTGGTSDAWVNDVLKTSENKDAIIINCIEKLGADKLLCVESIGDEDAHEHNDGEEHNHTHDEHIWLSLINAELLVQEICNAVVAIDQENKSTYENNCKEYRAQLNTLHKDYEKAVNEAAHDTLIFADRFPFIYLTNDYSLNYYAAFSGCSAESEASFETITRLSGKVDELSLSYIMISETSDGSVAETVRDSTQQKNQEILTLNAMQSVTKDKLDNSYISIMTDNLSVLIKALS